MSRCNAMNEVWVPSDFSRQVREKIMNEVWVPSDFSRQVREKNYERRVGAKRLFTPGVGEKL